MFGLGALCFYGLGLSNEIGAIDRSRCVNSFSGLVIKKLLETSQVKFIKKSENIQEMTYHCSYSYSYLRRVTEISINN